ncbi:A disintegrin and metalloproteinase with thrombospondin motifs adt-2 isoform X1 [Strongylocentrotus purpuratus]|uniref:Uncharacterized protein n=1 Tax=Strongylocentrotus purpuratus TaxID=7668 RepID=A0A7M7TGA2_STRPU|nr:A disintegrin and metalloproteinase with thrombospondin motifs adt-2 isoform X1 [Strongylocentrotus purpuratus]
MDPLTKRVITSSLLLFLIVCSYANPTHSSWSACSVSCGDGAKTRSLTNGSIETRPCNMQDCAVWGPWSFLACPNDYLCDAPTFVFETRQCNNGVMCKGASFRAVPNQICPDCFTAADTTATPTSYHDSTTILTTLLTDVA